MTLRLTQTGRRTAKEAEMCDYSRDDLDAKGLKRLLNEEQLAALSDLVGWGSALLFDSVAGEGCTIGLQRGTAAHHLPADHGADGGGVVQTRAISEHSLFHIALSAAGQRDRDGSAGTAC
jgi:hypothetical protein